MYRQEEESTPNGLWDVYSRETKRVFTHTWYADHKQLEVQNLSV